MQNSEKLQGSQYNHEKENEFGGVKLPDFRLCFNETVALPVSSVNSRTVIQTV